MGRPAAARRSPSSARRPAAFAAGQPLGTATGPGAVWLPAMTAGTPTPAAAVTPAAARQVSASPVMMAFLFLIAMPAW
jgi:hypothetical protein